MYSATLARSGGLGTHLILINYIDVCTCEIMLLIITPFDSVSLRL